jgi:hypothetical protein
MRAMPMQLSEMLNQQFGENSDFPCGVLTRRPDDVSYTAASFMTADMRAGPSDILKRAGKTATKIAGCQAASEVIGLAGFPIEQKFFGT